MQLNHTVRALMKPPQQDTSVPPLWLVLPGGSCMTRLALLSATTSW